MDPSSVIIGLLFLYFYKMFSYCHATLDLCQVVWILDSFIVSTSVYNKALREGFNVCEHHKCFILPMHRLGCWKERLLYSVPALVCAISHEFLCLPHCYRFLQYPLPSLREGGRVRNHCTDCCKKSEWIWVIVYVCMCVSATKRVSCMQSVFELTRIIEYTSSVTWHSWRFHNAHDCHSKPQRPISVSTTAGVCRLAHRSDLLMFVHGRPLKCHRSFNNHDQKWKKNLGRLPTLATLCMCSSSSISTNQSLQKTFHENS